MLVEQLLINGAKANDNGSKDGFDIVFAFAEGETLVQTDWFDQIKNMYPNAKIVGCSTSGNIYDTEVVENSVAVTAVKFERSHIKLAFSENVNPESSYETGESIAKQLLDKELKHILVFSDGLSVNGSKLADGFNSVCSSVNVHVSGGLAGDGDRFSKTYVIADDTPIQNGVIAIGIYGQALAKTGCFAGWDEFGTERIVTKSNGNVVYEIDGQKALELYKKYLGDESKNLPGSGLKFPLSIKKTSDDPYIIRTLLAVDENEQSLTFAGDIAEGSICKLMKSNIDKLIDNAGMAAKEADYNEDKEGLCIAVSCVGRKIVLGKLVEEELEILKEVLGEKVKLCGFYSYGEIAPIEGLLNCSLHNQTMTVTTIFE